MKARCPSLHIVLEYAKRGHHWGATNLFEQIHFERNLTMCNILAIDLGKFNSAVCIFDRSSLKSKFKTIRTRKQVMHDLFVWCVIYLRAG